LASGLAPRRGNPLSPPPHSKDRPGPADVHRLRSDKNRQVGRLQVRVRQVPAGRRDYGPRHLGWNDVLEVFGGVSLALVDPSGISSRVCITRQGRASGEVARLQKGPVC